ncbi:hypothetical protein FQZ97_1198830 [compost metagenome]
MLARRSVLADRPVSGLGKRRANSYSSAAFAFALEGAFFFAAGFLAAAFFGAAFFSPSAVLAADLRAGAFFVLVLPALAAISTKASSSVTLAGSLPFGSVALTLPQFTYGP